MSAPSKASTSCALPRGTRSAMCTRSILRLRRACGPTWRPFRACTCTPSASAPPSARVARRPAQPKGARKGRGRSSAQQHAGLRAAPSSSRIHPSDDDRTACLLVAAAPPASRGRARRHQRRAPAGVRASGPRLSTSRTSSRPSSGWRCCSSTASESWAACVGGPAARKATRGRPRAGGPVADAA
eukprot:7225463-Prymnesium_polylepis.2